MKFVDTARLVKLVDHLEYMEFIVKFVPKIIEEENEREYGGKEE